MKIRNKWVVLVGAIFALMTIGSIYSWSLFNAPIAQAYGLELNQVVLTFAIAIFFFAFATLISGPMNIKKGPRLTALVGAILYAGGVFLSAFATEAWMLYITYGAIAGAGVGFVYVVPLATLVKWFPKKKGTFTGISVGTFAAGSIIFKEIIGAVLGEGPYTPEIIRSTFMTLGVIYLVTATVGALLLDLPEATEASKKADADEYSVSPKQMLKKINFVLLFFGFLATTMPGILVLGAVKDIGVDLVGLDISVAAGLVSIVAVFNAGGRLASGVISDKIGPLNVLRIMAFVSVVALAMLSFLELNYVTFVIAILGVVAGYGSFLAMFPTVVASLWGSKYYSANYGIVYQGYGIAALVGPVVLGLTTGFTQAFFISMFIAIAGLVFVALVHPKHEMSTHKRVFPFLGTPRKWK